MKTTEERFSNSVALNFFCVQPLRLSDDLFISLLSTNLNAQRLEVYSKNTEPKWITKFNKEQLYRYFNVILYRQGEQANAGLLATESTDKFKVNGISLAEAFDVSNCCFYTIYDTRLRFFIIVYEIQLFFAIDTLNNITAHHKDNRDLYNTIRSLLVKEEEDSPLSRWCEYAREDALKTTTKFIQDVYSIKTERDKIYIDDNTGNITNVAIIPSGIDKHEFNKINKNLISLNQIADSRVVVNDEPILLNRCTRQPDDDIYDYDLYYFGSRFHTITTSLDNCKYRFIPIQFHIQYMWFYLRKINNTIDVKYNEARELTHSRQLEANTHLMDELIFIIETLKIHNERFKLVIEKDNRIYTSVEKKWNIESLLSCSTTYISFFKDYLSRLHNTRTTATVRRQNKILLVISLLQFIALISVWTDYINLLNEELQKNANELLPLFGSYSALGTFNTYLPIGIFAAIALMVLYIFFEKKNVTKYFRK